MFTNTTKGWRQTALLTDSQAAPADGFGDSVAVSGTTLAVGAPDQGSSLSGTVYVFAQTAKGWHQTAELKGSDTRRQRFVRRVRIALSGTTLVATTSVPDCVVCRPGIRVHRRPPPVGARRPS